MRASDPDKPPNDATVAAAMRRCVGADIPLQILAHDPWIAGMALVAQKFASGRTFLAGDAAHLFTPTGGFGMNTGIDDAANLAWKLAATLQGWGGGELLSSYETERLPIALRNTEAARKLTENVSTIDINPRIEIECAPGEAARRALTNTFRATRFMTGSVRASLCCASARRRLRPRGYVRRPLGWTFR